MLLYVLSSGVGEFDCGGFDGGFDGDFDGGVDGDFEGGVDGPEFESPPPSPPTSDDDVLAEHDEPEEPDGPDVPPTLDNILSEGVLTWDQILARHGLVEHRSKIWTLLPSGERNFELGRLQFIHGVHSIRFAIPHRATRGKLPV